MRYIY